MIRTYLTSAWRNLLRRPHFSLLNIICLSVGIATTICIVLYLQFEWTYDHFHDKADHIYRIHTTAIQTQQKTLDVDFSGTSANLGPLIEQNYPEVTQFVRLYQFHSGEQLTLTTNETSFQVSDIFAADPNIFEVFSFSLIEGHPSDALKGPNKITISESLAKKIFGAETAIGQVLETDIMHNMTGHQLDLPLVVTGVFNGQCFPRINPH